jgi:hypothetical protein
MFKKFSILLVVVVGGIVFWFVFALWVGIYSVYSFPPSKEHPEGATLIVSREEYEPAFNSPDYKPPESTGQDRKSGIGFAKEIKAKRPLRARTIIELPYIKWAYDKSVEGSEKAKNGP